MKFSRISGDTKITGRRRRLVREIYHTIDRTRLRCTSGTLPFFFFCVWSEARAESCTHAHTKKCRQLAVRGLLRVCNVTTTTPSIFSSGRTRPAKRRTHVLVRYLVCVCVVASCFIVFDYYARWDKKNRGPTHAKGVGAPRNAERERERRGEQHMYCPVRRSRPAGASFINKEHRRAAVPTTATATDWNCKQPTTVGGVGKNTQTHTHNLQHCTADK